MNTVTIDLKLYDTLNENTKVLVELLKGIKNNETLLIRTRYINGDTNRTISLATTDKVIINLDRVNKEQSKTIKELDNIIIDLERNNTSKTFEIETLKHTLSNIRSNEEVCNSVAMSIDKLESIERRLHKNILYRLFYK